MPAGGPPPSTTPAAEPQAGYGELLRGNANFRRLWAGSVVSLFGDWFNTFALYRVIDELTGSPLALGGVFLTKSLPLALASPIAGVWVDRFNRRRLMIGTDIARAVLVLGFLFIDEAGEIGWLYALAAAQVVVTAFFQPAKSSSLPNVTSPRELLTANALLSATWSTMLALGAAAGGWAVEALGTQAVFVIDSGTYLVSAWFIWRTRIPQDTDAPGPAAHPVREAVARIGEGWRYLREHPFVGRIALAKATWTVGGGACVYTLALLGEEVMPEKAAMGIGWLFAARGVGTGVGPVLARAAFPRSARWAAVMGACIVGSGVCYGIVGMAPWTIALVGWVFVAHAFSGANWVLSSTLLQQRTPDRYRGRVISTDWLLVTLVQSVSIAAASVLLETGVLDLRATIVAFAAVQGVTGLAWLAVIVPRERRAAAA